MPRTCTICAHPEQGAIDQALAVQEPFRHIASRFGTSTAALQRHQAEHLPAALIEAQRLEDAAEAVDVLAELRRTSSRLSLLFDACDAWLRDADDPTRYDIGPRAEEISVTYLEEIAAGRKIRRKAKLSELLARIEGSYEVVWSETKHADPRELALKVYDRIESQLTLIARLIGQIDDRPQINLMMSPEWADVRRLLVGALTEFPEARAAVADALITLEANGYRN